MWSNLGEPTTLRAYVNLNCSTDYSLSYKEKEKKMGYHEEKIGDHADSKMNPKLQLI